jgi:alpha-D-xyloside xylohydrolase
VWVFAPQMENTCFFVANPSGTKPTPTGPSYRIMGVVRNSSSAGGGPHTPPGFYSIRASMKAGDATERMFGLGQGNWTCDGGCASGCPQVVVPLTRNGQTIELLQRKFHVTIPFAYSTGGGGYGVLANMFGYGHVTVGTEGTGGMEWSFDAALGLDLWITAPPAGKEVHGASAVYEQYADATGHAPPLREDAMLFWQSRNRYKSSRIALAVADRYATLQLPVGVLVIDYKNQNHDGDFQPGKSCYPSLKALSDGVRSKINATTVFSFWPEVKTAATEYEPLKDAGCLINSDLGGLAIDATLRNCREMIWNNYVKPRYYDQGVNSYWLDETDGEGTAGGDVPGSDCDSNINDCGGYQTSFGPAVAYSNLWVNQWLALFSDPVAALKEHLPLVLTRGVWAGGQRHGIVLWSSDIESTFDELTSQVPQGVHASLSGIPWWTTDVGGYGCGSEEKNDSPYMRELIVRWYQFGCFSPVFRTHGHRAGADPDKTQPPCAPAQNSGGENEVWSYGNATQVILEKYIRLRASMKPYIQALSENVTARGVPTMRPLWYEFPHDEHSFGINDQYFLGPSYLVAPVTKQGLRSRDVYFPTGANWKNIHTGMVYSGGKTTSVPAPLDQIPVFTRA